MGGAQNSVSSGLFQASEPIEKVIFDALMYCQKQKYRT